MLSFSNYFYGQVIRPYNLIYSDNLHGGHTVIGNTLSAVYSSGSGASGTVDTVKMNDFNISNSGAYNYTKTSIYGNDNSNIQLVDIDGDTSTSNSSSAQLSLPTGNNNIVFARLYWGGRITGGMGGQNHINLRTIKFKFNSENYQTIVTLPTAIDEAFIAGSGIDSVYQAYYDITSFVTSRGSGTYTLADITAEVGPHSSGGNFAGWSMVVVYENPSIAYSSVRVYDGFLQVYSGGSVVSQSIELSGLNAPSNFSQSSDARMTVVTWEGDANLAADIDHTSGDYVRVNGIDVSNAVNPSSNFWNGTISKNGSLLNGNRYPEYKNQMGIDIDEVEVGTGYGIVAGTNQINVEFGTEADQYFPSLFAFSMITKSPLVELDKIVKDTAIGNAPWQIPNNLLNPNEILTYIITGKNLGAGNALNCVITDTLPGALTFKSGSLKINAPTPGIVSGFQTDNNGDDYAFIGSVGNREYVKFFIGNGATPLLGGVIAPNDSFSVQFQCFVPPFANTLNYVSNTARINGTEQDGITPFVDDGTATIGPPGIPLSVKMTYLNAQLKNGLVFIDWITSFESNNNRFEIERSFDSENFEIVGTVNAAENQNQTNYYSFNDPVQTSNQVVYYRLKIINNDEVGYYSKTMAINLNHLSSLQNLSFYPNPFENDLCIQTENLNELDLMIHLYNSFGQLETSFPIHLQQGKQITRLTALNQLPKGIHILEILSEETIFRSKVIKK